MSIRRRVQWWACGVWICFLLVALSACQVGGSSSVAMPTMTSGAGRPPAATPDQFRPSSQSAPAPTTSRDGLPPSLPDLPAAVSAVPSSPATPRATPVPPFGVSARGETADPAVRALAIQAGVRWVRSSVTWSAVEASPGVFNWAALDAHLQTLSEMNVTPVVYVSGNPAWAASSRCGPIDKVPLSEFARFVSVLVQRYNGKTVEGGRTLPAVTYWQFYNEPDNAWTVGQASGFDGCWGLAGADYAQMLAAAWSAVHTANPQGQVVFGGIAGESVECPATWECAGQPVFNFDINGGDFVDDVLEYMHSHPGSPYFDVFDFHYFPSFHSRWDGYGAGLSGKASYYRQRLADWGLERPLMCTETGRRSDGGQKVDGVPGSDEEQSRYVVRLLTQGMSSDLLALLWFTLADIVEPKQGGAAAWGLLTEGLQPKPSYSAYSTLTRELADLRYQGLAAVKGNMEGYVFAQGSRQTTVLWMRSGAGQPALGTTRGPAAAVYGQFAVRARQATVVSLNGDETVVSDGGSGDADRRTDGVLTIPVTQSPVFVRLQP